HVIGTQDHRRRDRYPQGLRSLQIDDEFEFRGFFHWKGRRPRAIRDLVDISRSAPGHAPRTGTEFHQSAAAHALADLEDGGEALLHDEFHDAWQLVAAQRP